MENENLVMPKMLTAENGAKPLMIGEFFEEKTECCHYEVCMPDDCPACGGTGIVTLRIPVSWTTIKAIYKKAVDHFGEPVS